MIDFIIALVMGGIIGWLASIVMRTDAQQGIFLNIVVGCIGSILGRLLLGGLTDREIVKLIPPGDFTLPTGEQMNMGAFVAEIRKAEIERFFSMNSIVDTFTHCLAAPVRDGNGRCVATVCIVAPKGDAAERYEHYRAVLMTAGEELSGYAR